MGEMIMENFFHLKERGTDVRTECIAGLTTFMTMAYILAVNPSILGDCGMDRGAVFTATALASAIASVCMALFANLPFVLSAGMGLNAYFAYSVVIGMGYSWNVALAAVFTEGLVFVVLSLTNIREAIFNAIPGTLKVAVSVGIGLFICIIGLKNSNVVVDSSTLIGLISFSGCVADGTMSSMGISALLSLIGILITAVLVIKNVRGNILLGILLTWLLGILCQLAGLYVPNPEMGFYSVIPAGIISLPQSMAPTFLKMSLDGVKVLDFVVVVFAFLFVDIFDTLGTLIGCATKADMLQEDGSLPGIRGALMADSVGTIVGACCGTSTITTFVESSAGIAEGGRTGLTSVVAGGFFLLSLLVSPVFLTIPSFATTPALVIVGFMMMQQVGRLSWDNVLEGIPAFICICAMPFTSSISEGIAFGIISWTVLHVACGKAKELTPLMYVLSVLFVLKYIFL